MANQKVIKILGQEVVSMDVNQGEHRLACPDCKFNRPEYTGFDGYCFACEFCEGVVFIDPPTPEKEVQKFTLEEIFEISDKFFANKTIVGQFFRDYVNKMVDPEYKEFLRLKEKFKDIS